MSGNLWKSELQSLNLTAGLRGTRRNGQRFPIICSKRRGKLEMKLQLSRSDSDIEGRHVTKIPLRGHREKAGRVSAIAHAVIYTRVSTREQMANLSLPTQEKACTDYCARQGLQVDRVFVEEGESAKSVDRT